MAIKLPKFTKQGWNTFATISGLLTGFVIRKTLLPMIFKRYIGVKESQAALNFTDDGSISGFVFNIVNSESVVMESDVTDHYIETNKSIHDHVAHKPVMITLKGLVGRYFYDLSKEQRNYWYDKGENFIVSLMPNVSINDVTRKAKSSVSGILNNSILQSVVSNVIDFGISFIMDKIRDYLGDFFGIFDEVAGDMDAEQKAFFALESLWQMAAPIDVITYWAIYKNMIITSIKPVKDGNGDITEFTVTLKQVSFVNSIVTDENQSTEPTNAQKQEEVDNGKTEGEKIEEGTGEYNDVLDYASDAFKLETQYDFWGEY